MKTILGKRGRLFFESRLCHPEVTGLKVIDIAYLDIQIAGYGIRLGLAWVDCFIGLKPHFSTTCEWWTTCLACNNDQLICSCLG